MAMLNTGHQVGSKCTGLCVDQEGRQNPAVNCCVQQTSDCMPVCCWVGLHKRQVVGYYHKYLGWNEGREKGECKTEMKR